jgi:hypothetical protein
MATESLVFHASRPSECSNGLHLVAPSCAKSDFLAEKLAAGGASFYTACFFVILFQTALPLESVHNSSASKILSAKACRCKAKSTARLNTLRAFSTQQARF